MLNSYSYIYYVLNFFFSITGMTSFQLYSVLHLGSTRTLCRLTPTLTQMTLKHPETQPSICRNLMKTTICITSISDGNPTAILWRLSRGVACAPCYTNQHFRPSGTTMWTHGGAPRTPVQTVKQNGVVFSTNEGFTCIYSSFLVPKHLFYCLCKNFNIIAKCHYCIPLQDLIIPCSSSVFCQQCREYCK